MKIYRCPVCGNIITKVSDSGVPVVCCGKPMEELVANTTDAAVEKHVPVVEVEEGKVKVFVGSVTHPMLPEHSIQWIALETKMGFQVKYLQPGEEPKKCFMFCKHDQAIAAYEYCNLHGLWKKDI